MKAFYLCGLSLVAILTNCGPKGLNENQPIVEPKKVEAPPVRAESEDLGLAFQNKAQVDALKAEVDALNLPLESWDNHKNLLSTPSDLTRSFYRHCPNFDVDGDGGINSVPEIVNGVQAKLPEGEMHYRGDGHILGKYILGKAVGLSDADIANRDWEILASKSGTRKSKIAILAYLKCLADHPDKPLDMDGDGRFSVVDGTIILRFAVFGYSPSVTQGLARVKIQQRFRNICQAYFQTEGAPLGNGKSAGVVFHLEQVACNANMDPYVRLPDLKVEECPPGHPGRRNLRGLSQCMGWKQLNNGNMVETWATYGGL